MANIEWKKLNFFNFTKNVDESLFQKHFQDNSITFSTSGNGKLIFGDINGNVHIVSKNWTVTQFKAYIQSVSLGYQLTNSSLLVTIGDDKEGTYPVLKVWDLKQNNRSNEPQCLRTTRLATQNIAVAATALAVCNQKQYIAVGFSNGSVLFLYGKIQQDRSSKQRIRKDFNFTITGLAFQCTNSAKFLFVTTTQNIYVYDLQNLLCDDKIVLDNIGYASKCALVPEPPFDKHFITGRKEGIYLYSTDSRGPCYAIVGEKILIYWFQSYLIVVTESIPISPELPLMSKAEHQIMIFDIQNKLIVFSDVIPKVKCIVNEWDSLFIISDNNNVYKLTERDTESKLSLLFKKNLYDVAIRLAESHHYDTDHIADIYRQYGDHLYSNGDHLGAVKQYIKTIGNLDSSYVIMKFISNQNIEMLAEYLTELHLRGFANSDHTALLLNCFHKIDCGAKLREFIMGEAVNLDIDTAIRVCHEISYTEEALYLAERHKKHDWYLKVQIECGQNYEKAINYIKSLESKQDCYTLMIKYGNDLFTNAKEKYMDCLKEIIAKTKDKSRINPNDFIQFFIIDSKYLVDFCSYLFNIEEFVLPKKVVNIFYEHVLRVWKEKDFDNPEKLNMEELALNLLEKSNIDFDKLQIMFLSKKFGFVKGTLLLLERDKKFEQILDIYFENGDYVNGLNACMRFGLQPVLWQKILEACSKSLLIADSILLDALHELSNQKTYSVQHVLRTLTKNGTHVQLGHVRDYFKNEFGSVLSQSDNNNDDISLDMVFPKVETLKNLSADIGDLTTNQTVFGNSKCSICDQQLELPSLHFLCQHSFHNYCFASFSENKNQCWTCSKDNRTVIESLKARDLDRNVHENFQNQLKNADNVVFLISKFLRRGIFQQNLYKSSQNNGDDDNDDVNNVVKSTKQLTITNPFEESYFPVKSSKMVSTNPFECDDDSNLKL